MEENVVVIGDLARPDTASDVVVLTDAETENALPKHAKLNDDGTVTLPLFVPVSLKYASAAGGVVKEDNFTEFNMRRLTGGDMELIQGAGAGQAANVAIALSAGIQRQMFKVLSKKMDGADLQAAGAVVTYFLTNGPRTGRSS